MSRGRGCRPACSRAREARVGAQGFHDPAPQIVFREAIDTSEDTAQRLRRVEQQTTRFADQVGALRVGSIKACQALRAASVLVAIAFAGEIGDVRRFDTPC